MLKPIAYLYKNDFLAAATVSLRPPLVNEFSLPHLGEHPRRATGDKRPRSQDR
jgi:hypothetical protein